MTIFIGGDNSDFIKKWESTKRALKRGLGSEAMSFSESIVEGFAAATAAMGALGIASIKMAGDMQANKKAFSTLLGDSQQAEKFLGDLAKFAAETPFELPGLANASKKLLAFGFSAQDIIPMMAAIGDAAAMLGVGQEGIDRLTLAIGQMQAKGKVSAEEIMQLAEAGIPAWKFLADAIGTDIPTAMKMAENGAIDSTTGINAVLIGMQTKFKGGMQGLSQEIPGLFSTIKDNVSAVMREIGDKLIAAFNIKEKMKDVVDYLDQFAMYVKNNGINEALRNLIPKELSLAIFVVAGALVGAAIPAVISFGIALWTALGPLLPFIAAGAALAAVAWAIWQAWEPLGELFSSVWNEAVSYTQQKWAELKSLVFSGVASVINAVMPLINLFGGSLQTAATNWLSDVSQSAAIASNEAAEATERVAQASQQIKAAFSGIKEKLLGGAEEIKNSATKLNITFTGLTSNGNENSTAKISVPNGGAINGSSEWDKLERKAEQVSKAIEDQWVQTTKTEAEQLDIWLNQQLAALEETKAANENYQRDLERLEATYSVRRRKIMLEEEKKRNTILDQAADTAKALENKLGAIGLSGVQKQKFDIEVDVNSQLEAVSRKYRDWITEYAAATNEQKEIFRSVWEANGIQFETTETGMINFSKQISAEQVAIEKEKNQKIKDLHYERVKFQEDLDAAREAGDIKRFQELLTTEQAMLAQELAGKQKYIDAYYEVWKASHQSAMDIMAQKITGIYEGLSTCFSDIITGTKSIGEAWQDLGKSIMKIIADIAAKWLASRIVMGLFPSLGSVANTNSSNSKNTLTSKMKFAAGGNYPGGLALVGEKGPELINFNRGGHVFTAEQTKGLLNGNNNRPSIINMNITTPDASSFRRSQAQILAEANTALALGRRNL